MNKLFVLFLFATLIFSCGDKAEKQKEADPAANTKDSAGTYLPIAGLLNEDMRRVDSFASGILYKSSIGNKKDSAFIQFPQFKELAAQFFLKDLDSTRFNDQFSETSLMDESTRQLNFIYTAKDSTSTLRQVITYVSPSLATDNIDRIYMETMSNQGDTLVEKRFTWKFRKYFYVITRKQPATGEPVTSMEKLI